jgi:hypothetical protein
MKFDGYTYWGSEKCAAVANKSADEFSQKEENFTEKPYRIKNMSIF